MKSKLLIFWIRCRLGWFRWGCTGALMYRRTKIIIELTVFMAIIYSLAPLLKPYIFFHELYLYLAFLLITGVYKMVFHKKIQQKLEQKVHMLESKLTNLYMQHNFNEIEQLAVDKIYTAFASLFNAFVFALLSVLGIYYYIIAEPHIEWSIAVGLVIITAIALYYLTRLLTNLIQFIKLIK